MRIELLATGKTEAEALQSLIGEYQKRLSHYVDFTFTAFADLKVAKNLSEAEQKKKEGGFILEKLQPSDKVILLCERGKMFTSMEFAEKLQKDMGSGIKRLVFVIGGPYGFSDELYGRADESISLSKMTFSHQMVRLFFIEQLYRAQTILKNEPYHHR